MSSNAGCCCFCGQTGTFVKEFDRKYRSREIIDGVKEKCIADHIVSPDIVSWNSLYNNDESGDSVPLVPIMACTASWRDVKRGGRKTSHFAHLNIDVVITSPPYSLLKDEFLYELVSLTSKWLILKVPFQWI